MAKLLAPASPWSAERWRAFFDERVANAKSAGHTDPERLAYLHCRFEWADHSPPPDPGEGLCLHCREPLGEDFRTITTKVGERRLHTSCGDRYADDRARMAKVVLVEAGVEHPPDE